jgi:hypothetical protein
MTTPFQIAFMPGLLGWARRAGGACGGDGTTPSALNHDQIGTAIVVGGLLTAIGAAVTLTAPGAVMSRLVLSCCLMEQATHLGTVVQAFKLSPTATA